MEGQDTTEGELIQVEQSRRNRTDVLRRRSKTAGVVVAGLHEQDPLSGLWMDAGEFVRLMEEGTIRQVGVVVGF